MWKGKNEENTLRSGAGKNHACRSAEDANMRTAPSAFRETFCRGRHFD
jgi:hypothetical protein